MRKIGFYDGSIGAIISESPPSPVREHYHPSANARAQLTNGQWIRFECFPRKGQRSGDARKVEPIEPPTEPRYERLQGWREDHLRMQKLMGYT